MDDISPVPPSVPPEPDSFALLAARVADLERQVAALSAPTCNSSYASTPPPKERIPSMVKAEPPPLRTPPIASTSAPLSSPAAPKKSLEDRLGSQVFNFIGIVALIFGSAWALKLAIEHGLVGPAARVIIGLAAGIGLVLWSEFFRRRSLAAFSYTLKAVGTGILYLSLWAAFQLYHLLPAPVALIAMILVTAWNAYMAFAQDAELLAAYALVGGLLTPLLLSTGGDHEIFLFTYVAVIDLAVVALQRAKPWSRLLIPAFLATVVYFSGYFFDFFHRDRVAVWDAQSSLTTIFLIVFFVFFALVSTKFWTRDQAATDVDFGIITPILIPLGNAAFLAIALYAVFEDSGLHDSRAWLMIVLAAIFLALMRLQRTAIAAAMHLAAAVVFLTVAIPLKASGHSLTTAWLVEGLVLYWASTKLKDNESRGTPYPHENLTLSAPNPGAPHLASEMWERTTPNPSQAPAKVLYILSAAGYLLGLGSVLAHWPWLYGPVEADLFLNGNVQAALVAAATLAGAVWLARARPGATGNVVVTIAALSAIDVVALLFALRESFGHIQDLRYLQHGKMAFANVDFATALMGLALVAGTTWAAFRSEKDARGQTSEHLLRLTAFSDLVLFNLMALYVFVIEISNFFHNDDAGLQRSLAISGFLMFYAAILLAAGFWRRNAFVRWQALILILFTIAKVFLYDISGLSAGYRVASFLALGALLLTVSFAYQKDWLSLKTPPPDGESA